jgi:methylated-DNA-[protein]-cysteine S-methyltransferase
MTEQIFIGYCQCPIGIIEINAYVNALYSVKILTEYSLSNVDESKDIEIIKIAKMQLIEYFNKVRKQFDIPMVFEGTEFQKKVWNEVVRIPFGKTKTYGQIAIHLGNKEYTRAVGSANGKNPLWIVVPCHCVMGANKELTGYAGGLWRKQLLLEHESKQCSLF